MGQATRETHRSRVGPGGEPVDLRTAGIAETEEFCHLVDALPRGVVARLPEDRQVERRRDAKQRRVAAGDDQREERQARAAGAEIDRQRVGVQVVDLDERHAPAHRERLAEGGADQQRAHQAGAGGHGDRAEIGGRHPGLVERGLHDGHEVLQVLAPGDLRHDAAVGPVVVDLRGDRRTRARAGPCSTTAAAVSSHDVSMPRISIRRARAPASSRCCRFHGWPTLLPAASLPASAAASAVTGPGGGVLARAPTRGPARRRTRAARRAAPAAPRSSRGAGGRCPRPCRGRGPFR